MNWRVEFAPGVEPDVAEAADWYEARQPGLGLNCRRHPTKNIRWRYPDRFPYRVIYEVNEAERTVKVAAVLHAARHDRHWQRRV